MSHLYDDPITKIKICYSLWRRNVKPDEIAKDIRVHRATVYRWIQGFRLGGKRYFISRYTHAKKGRKRPSKTHGYVKAVLFRLRVQYKQCCGEKLQYLLEKEIGVRLAVCTIYRILTERFVLRKKWKTYAKRGFVRKGTKPRDVIQVDTVDLGDSYAFTAIDTYTRETHVTIHPELTASEGRKALRSLLKHFGPINHIQRDGGSEFKAEWIAYANKHIPSIRTARPYKKNEQAFIERFNGILRKECLGHNHYKKTNIRKTQEKVHQYLEYYHTKRPHLSLNLLTPAQFAANCRI